MQSSGRENKIQLWVKHGFRVTCPCCMQKVPWSSRTRFSGFLWQRKAAPCPNCGSVLVWTKWGYRLMVAGLLLAGLVIIAGVSLPGAAEQEGLFEGGIFLAMLAVILGYVSLRLTLADGEKCADLSAGNEHGRK